MSTILVAVIVVIAVVAVVVAAGLVLRRRGQRKQLRERFGPEYDRVIGVAGNSKEGEASLRARTEQRDQLTIRPLSTVQRDRYAQDWRQIQAEFVDYPARSLVRADTLVNDVMLDQGYPMQDFDRRADLISVDHPEVVQHYRNAHGIYEASQAGQASTEDIRDAFISYRQLFADLLGDGSAEPGSVSAGQPPSASPPPPAQSTKII